MRWSQGVWSEQRIREAINSSAEFAAIPYGPSGVAPEGDPREFALYFDRLDAAGLGKSKRPDLLVVRKRDGDAAENLAAQIGGWEQLPFIPERELGPLLRLAVCAIECENSLWKAEKMPAYGQELRLNRRTGLPGMPKSAVLPTVIIKQEDRLPLRQWQQESAVPIHVWQVFFDRGFGISLDEAEHAIESGQIPPTQHTFPAPGGATTSKIIYKIFYQLAYEVGRTTSEPRLVADSIEESNGHILPFVRFEGGALQLDPRAEAMLRNLALTKEQ